jgi:hypothetical protein
MQAQLVNKFCKNKGDTKIKILVIFFRVEAHSGETAYTSYILYALLRQPVSTAAHNFHFYPKTMQMILKYYFSSLPQLRGLHREINIRFKDHKLVPSV